MDDKVEFRRNPWRLLISGLALLGGGAWFFWEWWNLMYGVSDGNQHLPPGRYEGGYIITAIVAAGFGLWELSKVSDARVQVAVDRHGITDFRLTHKPIAWDDVERIDSADRGKGKGLLLVLHADSPLADLSFGKREVAIWQNGLDGGPLGLKRAITRLAPQVKRFWSDDQI